MPSQLSIYNGALKVLGERRLADLDETREARFEMDSIWDNEFLQRILQMGQWNFAARSVELTASPSVTPSFGYQFAFDKPEADFIRTMAVCYDQYFEIPITRYSDEGQWIFCDTEIIYLKYVSNDEEHGTDLSLWPANFTEMAEHYMAKKIAPVLIGLDLGDDEIDVKFDKALLDAKNTDAMESPAKFAPQGSWANSRRGYRKGDRGNRHQF